MEKPYKEIQKQFNDVIAYSQVGIPYPETDELFKNWWEAKKDIRNYFGDKLIIELPEPITLTLDERAQEEKINSLIAACSFTNLMNIYELGQFIESQKEGFFKNIVTKDYRTVGGIHIKAGTKLVKAFKYFIDDKNVLEDYQNAASRIIQENEITGKLCFSIHPLDFLSVSENNYNWRSCHSLDGEYRAGNLSYMQDSTTIVCYLKGENEVILPRFPQSVKWNNKKWRVLLYLSNDRTMIFAGRQYPFSSQTAMNYLLELFNKNIIYKRYGVCNSDMQWSDWSEFQIGPTIYDPQSKIEYNFGDFKYIPVNQKLMEIGDIIKDNGECHFNDVLDSSCYEPMYSFLKLLPYGYQKTESLLNNANTTRFEIGHEVACLRCGDTFVSRGEDTMMCWKCNERYGERDEDYSYCDACGERVYDSEEGYWVEDCFYCAECYEKYFVYCIKCGKILDKNEDIIWYDEDTGTPYCEDCRPASPEAD